mgnify:CR=1 FL=1
MKILYKNIKENFIIVKLTNDEFKKISFSIIINQNSFSNQNHFLLKFTKEFSNIYFIKFNKDLNICCEYIQYIINGDLEKLENSANNTRIAKINKIKNKINKTKLNF